MVELYWSIASWTGRMGERLRVHAVYNMRGGHLRGLRDPSFFMGMITILGGNIWRIDNMNRFRWVISRL
jgi:hypothetical protein